jgi:hypothetical protein
MSARGKFWLLALAGCLLFWWLVIESVLQLAQWAGVR